MKALYTGVLASSGVLYTEVIFINESAGNEIADSQTLDLTARLSGASLNGKAAMSAVIQNTILDYAATKGYGMVAADVFQSL